MTDSEVIVPCVGGLVYDEEGRLLMIRRGHDPGRGLWSVPGGRVEPGETDAQALVRELEEETGLTVEPGPLVGRVRRGSFDIADYRCAVVGGELRAGDDASEARWCTSADLEALPLVPELTDTLRTWNALPRA
jgi:ADP-ribose pyrophosphatase YjhB (NUDIX family)